MLGNFSFGDYGKREAIYYAWNFLINELQLPENRLSVSVLDGDEEAVGFWKKDIGLEDDRIRRLGREDNFWMMSATSGPCGPCSEIFWDQEKEVDGDRFLEIWNLVFMQYEQSQGEDGNIILNPLPSVCIDTGMGLERISSIVQGKPTNFDIDTMESMRHRLMEMMATSPKSVSPENLELAIRVIMDHLRAVVMLLAEGVLPEGTGRGHVLRRLIRRASLFGYKIGFNEPFLVGLVPSIANSLGGDDWYPEIVQRQTHIESIIAVEELSFNKALKDCAKRLSSVLKMDDLSLSSKEQPHVTAELALECYSSRGVPIDVITDLAIEHGATVDIQGYHKLREEQMKAAKGTWVGSGDTLVPSQLATWADNAVAPEFIGHDTLEAETSVLYSWYPNEETLKDELRAWVSLKQTPFYAEAGGQSGDIGHVEFVIEVEGEEVYIPCTVEDTISPYPGGSACKIAVEKEYFPYLDEFLKPGTKVSCHVDAEARKATQQAHTATHLLHSALRHVLGDHVVQAGSKVTKDGLRFDFTHHSALTLDNIFDVEDHVHRQIFAPAPVVTSEMLYKEAVSQGALGLFKERYPDSVRVVNILGKSQEICCGTHLESTEQLQDFTITSYSSVSATVRRIEATVGKMAHNSKVQDHRRITHVSEQLGIQGVMLQNRVHQLLKERKEDRAKIAQLRRQLAAALKGDRDDTEPVWKGEFKEIPFKLIEMKSKEIDEHYLQERMGVLCGEEPQLLFFFVLPNNKIMAQTLNKSLHCGKILKELLSVVGGKGGGKPNYAEGSLSEPNYLEKFQEVTGLVSQSKQA
eukprot:TRINITY_DN11650_c0_g1_i1.p1 TRINITY_DN11650_c0_g1~~TRINITY_DN11650_c0_g1_i1.p1  ORF type:complete len:928 (+),score=205.43 TRINITY_DN11650_c0_g1_i1:367-2784(+)